LIPQEAWALLIAFVVSSIVVALLLAVDFGRAAMDQPNHRSLHTVPVPRTGGLGILAGICAGWAWLNGLIMVVPLCVLALALVSFVDDMRNLGSGIRLLAHIVTAITLVWFGFSAVHGWLWMVFAVLAIVWMTNLYNFMDGSDGLAGGMALLGFGAYAVGSWLVGDHGFAMVCASLAAASAGFLVFNFHPARIFMGDVGSIPLGFTAAVFGLIGEQHENWPLWFPILVFSPFIVDATATLLKRVLHGEKVWEAHRNHYYQRLIQMGWGHRKTALCEYLLMLVTGSTAVFALGKGVMLIFSILAGWVLIYWLIMWLIDRLWGIRNPI
jgi:UDP-N-acetylmuramyl pentapeptide phosphotransferase/UDP-N-acetylglucosamine-1-phosphate transferase